MSRFNTGNPIGSADPRDRDDNTKNLDELVNSKTKTNVPDRLGVPRKTWHSMETQFESDQSEREVRFESDQTSRDNRFNDFIASSGYQFVGDYAPGIEITEYNQLVRDENGEFWRVSGQVDLPYVTTGAGIPEGDALVPAGDAVLRNDLANPDKGATMVEWERKPLSVATSTVGWMLDAQALSVWEFADLITDKPAADDPSTWDWTPTVQAAVDSAEGRIIDFPAGTYTFSATKEYTNDTYSMICAVELPSNTVIRFSPGVVITSKKYTGSRDYREIFLALKKSNVHFIGNNAFFDGGWLPGATGLPKVGIVFRASSNCSMSDLRGKNFTFHCFGTYAGDAGGSSDITFTNVIGDNGRASSLIAYSSVANYGHQPNRRIKFINCQGNNSGQYFGIEMRGCIDSLIDGGSFTGNGTGGVNVEENSARVLVRKAEIAGNGQGVIVAGQQGACPDIVFEDCNIHNNTQSQVANYAGDRMKLVRCRVVDGASSGVNILAPTSLPIATGVEIIDSVITGNGTIGFLCRGPDARIRNSVIAENGSTGVQVSADGLQYIDSIVDGLAYDTGARRTIGRSMDVDPVFGVSHNFIGRLRSDNDRVRLVVEGVYGEEWGGIDVVRQTATSGRTEVYAFIDGARTLVATFYRTGDLELHTAGSGLIVKSSNGTRYRILVSNSGELSASPV